MASNNPIIVFFIVVIFCGGVYVGNYWSPSSYGFFLKSLGVVDAGVIYGEPRPIRSDEWAVVTPLTQAAVANNYKRYNSTSLYNEDLRINYGLPIKDWGLIFKPTMWGFLFLSPAHAFSLHWYLILALFISGHTILFWRMGLAFSQSLMLSVILYYTGFTQFWWNEKGPIFALFPWVIIPLVAKLDIKWRLMLSFWVGTSWMLTNFYPPVFVSLTFFGIIFILYCDDSWLKINRLFGLFCMAIASSITVAVYLRDYLSKTSNTLYPGHRRLSGGSVPWQEFVAQEFPFSTFNWNYESIIGQNICEVGVVGSAVTLMMICFLDYSKGLRVINSNKKIYLVGAGVFLQYCWMVFPIPPSLGALFLWNHVQPERMEYSAGLGAIVLATLLANAFNVVFTKARLLVYTLIIIFAWWVLKSPSMTNIQSLLLTTNDLVVIPAIFIVLYLRRRLGFSGVDAMLLASALASAVVFFEFNPIQSTLPLFSKADSPRLRELSALAKKEAGILAVGGLPGATANGLGFASVSHVTAVPVLGFWRALYNNGGYFNFENIFNRYSHISIISDSNPKILHADNVGVPSLSFPFPLPSPNFKEGTPSLPKWINQGEILRGATSFPGSGPLWGIDLLIGNGGNTSDGALTVKACGLYGCSTASRELENSIDNQYLEFRFGDSIYPYDTNFIDYEISLTGGESPVAIWSFEKNNEDSIIRKESSSTSHLEPKMRIRHFSY